MEKRRILFRLDGCPYCKRAEEALDKAKVKYQKHEINPEDRKLVQMLSGQSSVPILVEVIGGESQDDDIVEYVKGMQRA